MRRLVTALVGLMLIAATAACGGKGGNPPPTSPNTPTVTASPANPATPDPGGGGGGPTVAPRPATSWTSGPVAVRHDVPVPPVPRITGIRSAFHPEDGYDRIVFDIAGALPGYEVRYVAQPFKDPSGLPANVPGRRFLQITLQPAQAHTDAGQPMLPRARTVNYPMLEAWAITGDFEGVVTVVLGLDDVIGYRVGELPGRVYVDVAA